MTTFLQVEQEKRHVTSQHCHGDSHLCTGSQVIIRTSYLSSSGWV